MRFCSHTNIADVSSSGVPYRLVTSCRRFEGLYCVHLQGQTVEAVAGTA